jgi:hypothetical protein
MIKPSLPYSILLVVFIIGSCDPLGEHVGGPYPEIEFISPANDTEWHQPGSTVSIEIQVKNCNNVEHIVLLANNLEIIAEEQPQSTSRDHKYRFEIPVLLLLENLFSEPMQRKAIDLKARLSCLGYFKPIESPYHYVHLSPFDTVVGFHSEVRHLHTGPLSNRQLTICKDGLHIKSEEEGYWPQFNVFNRRGSVRLAQDSIFFWGDCTAPVCVNHSGTLYRLRKSDLWPYFNGIEMATMQTGEEPVDIVDAADPNRIMMAQQNDPAIWFFDPDFGDVQKIEVDFQPVGPFRQSEGGEYIVLGLPVWYLNKNVQIAVVGPGPSISQKTTDLTINALSSAYISLWALSDDGHRAVILDLSTGQLHRILTNDGSLLPTISIDLMDTDLANSIAFAGEERVFLVTQETIRLYDFESDQEIWALAPEKGITDAVPRPNGGFALLTGDLDLWIVNDLGEPVLKMGELPHTWSLSSNLVTSSDGTIRFALGNIVISYQIEE